MLCPHCQKNFHEIEKVVDVCVDRDGGWKVLSYLCPACKRASLYLLNGKDVGTLQSGGFQIGGKQTKCQIRPAASGRPPCPVEVPKDIAEDYTEACIVLPHSARASAALSRRCLQHLLHHQGYKDKNLDTEIQNAVKSGSLPSHLSEALDAIRVTGNFAAHPMKSSATGEIVPVEDHEAEWNLDTLEQLFDFFYVQPAVAKKKRDAMNLKLAGAGKPPLK